MSHIDEIRRRAARAYRKQREARRAEQTARIVTDVLSAIDAACANPRYNASGLVEIDLSDIRARAERLGFGDWGIFDALGDS